MKLSEVTGNIKPINRLSDYTSSDTVMPSIRKPKTLFPRIGVEAGGYKPSDIALSTLQGMGRDILQPGASFINQLLLNLPRTATEQYGYEYPTEKGVISPTAKAISYGAGVVGGLKNPLLKTLFTGGKLLPTMAKSAALSTIYGTEDMFNPENIATKAVVGGAIPLAGVGIAKASKLVASGIRSIAGVFPETAKQAIRIGMNRIADPIKRNAAYFTTNIVPRVQQNLNELLRKADDNTTQFLNKLGVPVQSSNALKKYGKQGLDIAYNKYQGNIGNVVENVKKGLETNLEDAGHNFDLTFNRSKIDEIKVGNALNKMRGILTDAGALDTNGNRLYLKYGNRTVDNLVNVYEDIRQTIRGAKQGAMLKPQIPISKAQYSRYKLMLEGGLSGDNKVDRLVYGSIDALRKDASKALPMLDQISKEYGMAKQMYDENYDKVSQNLLERKKWDLQTYKRLKELDKSLPQENKFFEDLTKFNSAKDINDAMASRFATPIDIEKDLSRLSNYKEPAGAKIQDVRDLYSHFNDKNIVDDTLAHYLALDLFQPTTSPGFLGIPALVRKGTEATTRFGLKYNKPAGVILEKGKELLRGIQK